MTAEAARSFDQGRGGAWIRGQHVDRGMRIAGQGDRLAAAAYDPGQAGRQVVGGPGLGGGGRSGAGRGAAPTASGLAWACTTLSRWATAKAVRKVPKVLCKRASSAWPRRRLVWT